MFDDDLKAIMFFLMVATIFLLIYGISRRVPRAEHPQLPPEPDREPVRDLPREARSPGSHYDPKINPDLVITEYNFRSFDAQMGPPDPDEFYDDLLFHAYNQRDGYRFEGALTVCTPRGLARLLREFEGEYVEGDGAIIVPRYDLRVVLRALLERHTDPAELHAKRWQERPVPEGE